MPTFSELNVIIVGANPDGTILLNNYLYCSVSFSGSGSSEPIIRWIDRQTGNTSVGASIKMASLGKHTFECQAIAVGGLEASDIVSVDVILNSSHVG